jgi:hypothetical protein
MEMQLQSTLQQAIDVLATLDPGLIVEKMWRPLAEPMFLGAPR